MTVPAASLAIAWLLRADEPVIAIPDRAQLPSLVTFGLML